MLRRVGVMRVRAIGSRFDVARMLLCLLVQLCRCPLAVGEVDVRPFDVVLFLVFLLHMRLPRCPTRVEVDARSLLLPVVLHRILRKVQPYERERGVCSDVDHSLHVQLHADDGECRELRQQCEEVVVGREAQRCFLAVLALVDCVFEFDEQRAQVRDKLEAVGERRRLHCLAVDHEMQMLQVRGGAEHEAAAVGDEAAPSHQTLQRDVREASEHNNMLRCTDAYCLGGLRASQQRVELLHGRLV